eukprot:TCALIF_13598-PA protein Name:"Protein of unknown function" AED:0.91 eAED:1.00 QI:0/-1/0/1/-1/1/1/0/109
MWANNPKKQSTTTGQTFHYLFQTEKKPLPVEQSHQENNNPLPRTPLPTPTGALEDLIDMPKPLTPPSWAEIMTKRTLPLKPPNVNLSTLPVATRSRTPNPKFFGTQWET